MLAPTNQQPRRANINLPFQLRNGGAGTRSGVHASSSNNAVEERGNEDLAVGDDGHDVLVRSMGADGVVFSQSVGDFFGQLLGLRFGDGVVWFGGLAVEDGVVG